MSTEYSEQSILTIAFDITLPEYDGLLVCRVNSLTGELTEIVLPTPKAGRAFDLTKVSEDTNEVEIDMNGYTCNGESSLTSLQFIGDNLTLYGDGTKWNYGNPTLVIP